jgi:hypothetical protein
MTDNDTNEPRDPIAPGDAGTPKKGTFGAFADKYRDRWAAGHPDARKPGGRDVPAKPAPGTIAPTTPRDADGTDETPGAKP